MDAFHLFSAIRRYFHFRKRPSLRLVFLFPCLDTLISFLFLFVHFYAILVSDYSTDISVYYSTGSAFYIFAVIFLIVVFICEFLLTGCTLFLCIEMKAQREKNCSKLHFINVVISRASYRFIKYVSFIKPFSMFFFSKHL